MHRILYDLVTPRSTQKSKNVRTIGNYKAEGKRPFFVVENKSDLKQAPAFAKASLPLIAGNLHVTGRLYRMGLPAISAEEILSASDKAEVVAAVGHMAGLLQDDFERAAVPEQLKAIALANVVKALFTFYSVREAETQLGANLLRSENKKLVSASVRITKVRRAKSKAGLRLASMFTQRIHSDYELDFRSPSGLKIADNSSSLRLNLKPTRNPPWINLLKTILLSNPSSATNSRTVAWSFSCSDTRFDLGHLRLQKWGDPDVTALIEHVLSETTSDFSVYQSGMQEFLANFGHPTKAFFNHIPDQGIAGIVSTLCDAGIDCEMTSHGALVGYGDGPRHAVARILGGAIYNNFPGMTRIAPRSPLQANSAASNQTVIKSVRLSEDMRQKLSDTPFCIYYAPNFLSWHECFHGMTIDCFETYRCIEDLVSVVKSINSIELNLRIKTTAIDTSTRDLVPNVRGILPDDILHMIEPRRGVHDASFGSHSESLSSCDLVVTEGLTAVMFEALEHRKPLLLLNPNRNIIPSLPYIDGASLVAGAPRGAVYAASKEDNLAEILLAIARHHKGAPLTNAELEGYVWVGS